MCGLKVFCHSFIYFFFCFNEKRPSYQNDSLQENRDNKIKSRTSVARDISI
jgi:hypothetical protein